MIALLITGSVLAGASGLLDAVVRAERRVDRVTSQWDRQAAGDRLLRDLLARAELIGDAETGRPVVGGETEVGLRTTCDEPQGWRASCWVSISLFPSDTAGELRIRFADGPFTRLGSVPIGSRFIYLERSASETRWHREWRETTIAPAALGIVVDRDTMVYGVGASR